MRLDTLSFTEEACFFRLSRSPPVEREIVTKKKFFSVNLLKNDDFLMTWIVKKVTRRAPEAIPADLSRLIYTFV